MTDVVGTQKATGRRICAATGFALLTLWVGGPASADAAQLPDANLDPTRLHDADLDLPAESERDSARLSEPDRDAVEALEDGLQEVPVRGPGTFWVRPGVDLGAYDRIALQPLQLEYKKDPQRYRIDSASAGVLLTERDRERLEQGFYKAFKTGLASGDGFGPASRPDPGLLWVSASLIDVIVRSPKPPTGNELIFNQDYGEMTLRVDLTDSETGETVARFEERRTIGPSAGFMDRLFRHDYFSYWQAIRANLFRWSEIVRRRMYDQRAGTVQF